MYTDVEKKVSMREKNRRLVYFTSSGMIFDIVLARLCDVLSDPPKVSFEKYIQVSYTIVQRIPSDGAVNT